MGCKNICTTVEQPDETPLLGRGLLGAVQRSPGLASAGGQARLLDQIRHLVHTNIFDGYNIFSRQ